MSVSGTLHVQPTPEVPPQIVEIHPNDGFDMGLMTTEYSVEIYANVTAEEFNHNSGPHIAGAIHLLNECPHGIVRMNPVYFKRIGEPENVRLVYRNDKLLVLNMA